MINTIQQLKKNHQNFDVIWNKIGTEVQKDLVKTAPELLTALGAWYNRSNELIFELEDQIEQNALTTAAGDALQGYGITDEEEEDIEEYIEELEREDGYEEEEEAEENTDFGSDDPNGPRPGVSVNIPSGISL